MGKFTPGQWKELTIFDDGINLDMPNANDLDRAHRNLTFKMIDQYGNIVSGYIGSVHLRFISLFKTVPDLLSSLKELLSLCELEDKQGRLVIKENAKKYAKQAIAKAEGGE